MRMTGGLPALAVGFADNDAALVLEDDATMELAGWDMFETDGAADVTGAEEGADSGMFCGALAGCCDCCGLAEWLSFP